MAVKFGIFDHLDRRDQPLGIFFDERLRFVAAADALGFDGYHVAEHHATPLGMSPVPGVYLAAAARETTRLRLGPLVYLLPLYHPLRLVEEICILDHLSGGRLDVGVGRGVSPIEVGYYGVDPAQSLAIFHEALGILIEGLTVDRLTHDGKFFQYADVPMELKPVQQPYPPIWCGLGSEESQRYAAQNGMNGVALGGNQRIAEVTAFYREIWDEYADAPVRRTSPVKTPTLGASRHIFVADTDAEAERLARPAYEHWYGSLSKLWRDHGVTGFTQVIFGDFDEVQKIGAAVIGSPDTVTNKLAELIGESGIDYLVGQYAFGSLTHEQEMRSLEMFATEVMPRLA